MLNNLFRHLKYFTSVYIAVYGGFWLFTETSDHFGTASLKNAGIGVHLWILAICFILSSIFTYVYFHLIKAEDQIQLVEIDRFPAVTDFQETFRNVNWPELIESAEETIDIVVYYFDSWVNYHEKSLEKFVSKSKTKIRVIVANPEDQNIIENVRRLFNEYKIESVQEKISHTNERFLQIFEKVGADKNRFEFYYYPYLLNYSLQLFDDKFATFSFFEMYRQKKIDSPAIIIDLEKSKHLKEFVKKELEGIIAESKKIMNT